MSGCNATLTTATVEDCPHSGDLFDARVCARQCLPTDYGLKRFTLYTLTCWSQPHAPGTVHRASGSRHWDDETPGARPHTPPLVTDAEVDAAMKAWPLHGLWDDTESAREDMRMWLEAAAKVRNCTHGIVVGSECKECGREDVR